MSTASSSIEKENNMNTSARLYANNSFWVDLIRFYTLLLNIGIGDFDGNLVVLFSFR